MKLRNNLLAIIISYCLLGNTSILFSLSKYKEVHILGLKIYSEELLLETLELKKLETGKTHFEYAAKAINEYYHIRGYILAGTYVIEENDNSLTMIVDEGRLGKIVFYNLSSINILMMRYEFKLKHKIYNKYAIEKETDRLKEKYGFKEVHSLLKPARKYDDALFQLDKEYELPVFGKTRLPFFNKLGYTHNLSILFEAQPLSTQNKFGYGLKTSYSKGLIPHVKYYHPSLVVDKDIFEVHSSVGIIYQPVYSLNVLQYKPPDFSDLDYSFIKIKSNYYFAPAFNEYLTPLLNALVHYSKGSRNDLGISEFTFIRKRGTIAPGITLLSKLRIYSGIGGERVNIDMIPNQDAEENPYKYPDTDNRVDNWGFLETRIIDQIPWILKETKKKKIEFIYDYYFKRTNTFHKINSNCGIDFEFKNSDVYSFQIEFIKVWKDPPFYHEIPVSNKNFKGLMSKGFFTRRTLRAANEYKISIYRSFIHMGIFMDLTWFEGPGYVPIRDNPYDIYDDLDAYLYGNQYSIVYGVAGHIIILDQFQFNIYYGYDYLFSTKESKDNIYMKLRKKW